MLITALVLQALQLLVALLVVIVPAVIRRPRARRRRVVLVRFAPGQRTRVGGYLL